MSLPFHRLRLKLRRPESMRGPLIWVTELLAVHGHRSTFREEKKLITATMSRTLPDRLIERVTALSALMFAR